MSGAWGNSFGSTGGSGSVVYATQMYFFSEPKRSEFSGAKNKNVSTKRQPAGVKSVSGDTNEFFLVDQKDIMARTSK